METQKGTTRGMMIIYKAKRSAEHEFIRLTVVNPREPHASIAERMLQYLHEQTARFYRTAAGGWHPDRRAK